MISFKEFSMDSRMPSTKNKSATMKSMLDKELNVIQNLNTEELKSSMPLTLLRELTYNSRDVNSKRVRLKDNLDSLNKSSFKTDNTLF